MNCMLYYGVVNLCGPQYKGKNTGKNALLLYLIFCITHLYNVTVQEVSGRSAQLIRTTNFSFCNKSETVRRSVYEGAGITSTPHYGIMSQLTQKNYKHVFSAFSLTTSG